MHLIKSLKAEDPEPNPCYVSPSTLHSLPKIPPVRHYRRHAAASCDVFLPESAWRGHWSSDSFRLKRKPWCWGRQRADETTKGLRRHGWRDRDGQVRTGRCERQWQIHLALMSVSQLTRPGSLNVRLQVKEEKYCLPIWYFVCFFVNVFFFFTWENMVKKNNCMILKRLSTGSCFILYCILIYIPTFIHFMVSKSCKNDLIVSFHYYLSTVDVLYVQYCTYELTYQYLFIIYMEKTVCVWLHHHVIFPYMSFLYFLPLNT